MICTVSKRNFGNIVKPYRLGLAVSTAVTICFPPLLNFSLHYFTRGHFSSDIDLTCSLLLVILADCRLYFLLQKLYLFDIFLTEKRSVCLVSRRSAQDWDQFSFAPVFANGICPPPRPALSVDEPGQRKISFADSPRCLGSAGGPRRTCG